MTPEVLLAFHVKLTVCTGAGVPVPLRAEALGELVALLTNEADAAAPPLAPGLNVTVKLTGWLVVTVTGNESPLISNSEELVPLTPADETVTLALVAVNVPVCVPMVPTVTLPTLTELALNEPALGAIAVPLNVIPRLGFDAFEAIATLPLKLPADPGAKVTLKDALCPGVSVTFVPNPEMLKPVPLTVPCEMVALDPPVLVKVSVSTWLFPTATSVNVKLVGKAVKVAAVTGAVPVPETAISSVVLDPLIVIDKVSLLAPAEVGAKTTPKVVL